MRGSFLEGAPIVPVSSETGEGLEALRSALVGAGLAHARRGARGRARRGCRSTAPFSIPGFGPVVTGSLVSGTIRREQKLELLPARRPVRVRRLEVHGREEEVARAGERVSANLAGVELGGPASRDGSGGAGRAARRPRACSCGWTCCLGRAPLKSGDRVVVPSFRVGGARRRPGPRRQAIGRGGSAVACSCGSRLRSRRFPATASSCGACRRSRRSAGASSSIPQRRRRADGWTRKASRRSTAWSRRLSPSGSHSGSTQARERGAAEEDLARRAGVEPETVRDALAAPWRRGRIHALRRSPDRYVSEAALGGPRPRAAAGAPGADRFGGRRRSVSRGARCCSGCFPAPIRAGPRPSRRRSSRAARSSIAGEEARLPGKNDLAGPETRALANGSLDCFAERGLDPPSPLEASQMSPPSAEDRRGPGRLPRQEGRARAAAGRLVHRSRRRSTTSSRDCAGAARSSLDVGEFKEMFGLTRSWRFRCSSTSTRRR